MGKNKKRKMIAAIFVFITSLIFSIVFLTIIKIILISTIDGVYTINNPTEQEYLKEQLSKEININIPNESEITKIMLKILPDQSDYYVTYQTRGKEETVKNSIDWGQKTFEIDQYMKKNGENNVIIIYIVQAIQIILPIISFAYIIIVANKN